MSNENIKISLNSDHEGEVIVRTGEAKAIHVPQSLRIASQITGPAKWYLQHKEDASDHAFAEISAQNKTIVYCDDPRTEYNVKVTGSLKVNPLIAQIGINTDEKKPPEATAQWLKRFRHYFDDKNDFANIISKLRNFDGKVEQSIKREDDKRGNTERQFKQLVKSELPEGFNIRLPVYMDTPEQLIYVFLEISYVSNDSVMISFYSSDLHALLDQIANETLNEQAKLFESPVTVINVL